MSLYDKASLVLIPSGTKAGTVYSQKPVPSNDVVGDELVTNGTFDTDSDWTKESGWTISNGEASITSSGNVRLYQSGYNLDANKTYKLSVNVKSISSGSVRFRFGGTGSASNLEEITTTGVHTFISKPLITTSIIGFFVQAGTTVSIDNVSVRQVVDGDFDFTRSSYATRVNSQGLIEKERSNLLLQSNNFDTTWGVNFGLNTPTSGQTGYDGTSDAWLLEKDAYAFTYMFQDLSRGGLQTYSAYAKSKHLECSYYLC